MTNSVCSVIGTGWSGISMLAPSAVSAANAVAPAIPAAIRTVRDGAPAMAGVEKAMSRFRVI